MSPTAEQLYRSALALPAAERAALGEAFLAADHPPAPELAGDEYLAELRRRAADPDPASWATPDEVIARVHADLGIAGAPRG